MIARQLFLLSPYRPPTSYPVSLSVAEAAAWLHGWAALWHPAALAGAVLPPRAASAYDHNDPVAGAIYALPTGPSLYLPDDWHAKAESTGAAHFEATADRGETIAKFRNALQAESAAPEIVRLFAGVGFGYLMLETLFEASSHDRLLDLEAFWNDVQAAVAANQDFNAVRHHLTEAAKKLLVAREGLVPNGVSLVDLMTLNDVWPAPFSAARPITLLATSQDLRKLFTDHPARFAELKNAMPGSVELAIGIAVERDDGLLPVESQLWNLRTARREVQELLGVTPTIFGRLQSEYHPQLPSWLNQAGFRGMLALNLDGATVPSRYYSVIQWPGPDGKAINAYTRDPLPAHEHGTFFNFAHHLHEANNRESSPTVMLHHTQAPVAGYDDLLALCELAPVFGPWVGADRLLGDSHTAEYVSVPGADEFFRDTLEDRAAKRQLPNPVSGFAEQARQRRRLDSAFTLAALHHSLTPWTEEDRTQFDTLEASENAFELEGRAGTLIELETAWATKLAERLLARSEPERPGWLVLNSSGNVRRVGLELEAIAPIPVEGPVKASDYSAGRATVVVEVPGLGYAWIPRGVPGTVQAKPRMKTADGTSVRNEFLEAELDAATGAIKAIRDGKYRVTRLGQILCWLPGSRMVASEVKVTASNAVLGEVTSRGSILGEGDAVLAHFTQRVRAWIGRPALEIRIELRPQVASTGFPWHGFYGARFAWRDDRASLFRGVNGMSAPTTAPRPQSPDYLEVRFGKERSFLFTGGLSFLQKKEGRMVDLVLAPAGEAATSFEVMIAFDRDYPMAIASSWLTPPPVLAVSKGPPPTGASGWLANIDLPSLVLTSLRPSKPSDGMTRAVTARLMETAGFAGSAELKFARDPSQAMMVDLNGDQTLPLALLGDAVPIDCSANELISVKCEW